MKRILHYRPLEFCKEVKIQMFTERQMDHSNILSEKLIYEDFPWFEVEYESYLTQGLGIENTQWMG